MLTGTVLFAGETGDYARLKGSTFFARMPKQVIKISGALPAQSEQKGSWICSMMLRTQPRVSVLPAAGNWPIPEPPSEQKYLTETCQWVMDISKKFWPPIPDGALPPRNRQDRRRNQCAPMTNHPEKGHNRAWKKRVRTIIEECKMLKTSMVGGIRQSHRHSLRWKY